MNLAQQQPEFVSYTAAFKSLSEARPFAKYDFDPIAFAHDVLGLKYLGEHQNEFLTATVEHDRVARRSGHGIGKTFDLSIIGLHRLYTREAVVVTTAPTWPQVELLLWKEIRNMWNRAKKHLPGTLLKTKIEMPDGRYAVGRSTDDPNRFQGFHAPEVVVLEDESPGVHPGIHVAIEGVMTAGGLWVKVGNPTEPSGPFYDVFRDDLWHTMAMSCWDHPNVVQDKIIIPGAVTRKWCEDRLRKWGPDNPLYQSRVLGDFPTEGIDQVVSLKDIENAIARELEPPDVAPEIWCDVARFGDDDTCIGVRHGMKWREHMVYNGKDVAETIGHLRALADELAAEHDALDPQQILIGIDDTGVGGGVSDVLIDDGYNVDMFVAAAKAVDDDHFENRRAEAWWHMRTAIKHIDIDVEDAEELTAQLTGTKRKMTRKGKILMVSKDQMKAAGLKSPDRADAMVMAFAPNTLVVPL
jgi:hypothetical protein